MKKVIFLSISLLFTMSHLIEASTQAPIEASTQAPKTMPDQQHACYQSFRLMARHQPVPNTLQAHHAVVVAATQEWRKASATQAAHLAAAAAHAPQHPQTLHCQFSDPATPMILSRFFQWVPVADPATHARLHIPGPAPVAAAVLPIAHLAPNT